MDLADQRPLPKDQFSFGNATKLMKTSSLRVQRDHHEDAIVILLAILAGSYPHLDAAHVGNW